MRPAFAIAALVTAWCLDAAQAQSISAIIAPDGGRSGERSITSDHMVVDKETNQAIFTGNVVIKQGDSVLKAGRLVLDLATGAARLEATEDLKR